MPILVFPFDRYAFFGRILDVFKSILNIFQKIEIFFRTLHLFDKPSNKKQVLFFKIFSSKKEYNKLSGIFHLVCKNLFLFISISIYRRLLAAQFPART